MRIKKLFALFLSFLFLLTFLCPNDVYAKEPHLKNLNLRWNLKADKEITFKTHYEEYGLFSIKAKITKFKVKKAKKKGFKEAKFTLQYTFPKLEIDEDTATNIFYGNGFQFAWSILDYKSGLCLEEPNKLNVSVSNSGFIHSKEKYSFPTSEGKSISYSKTIYVNITISFPEKYKDLCFFVGGSSDASEDNASFWDGSKPFGTSSIYVKKDKKFSAFMRIK